mgnify:FL=1
MEYLKRQVDKELEAWKNSDEHKPLLVRGARQVGKSSSIRHLGASFPYFLEVNFERDKAVKEFFDADLDVKFISEQLSAYFKVPVLPGKTLLFLDEIQACPNAIHSLWFFKEDYPELHVIAAGSLLEFALKDLGAYGVGRIRSMFVYPMSFDEFLYALGEDSLVGIKQNATPQKPLMSAFYERLVERFRSFLLIGGMPAAVAKYVKTKSFLEVDQILSELKQTYIDDFMKYKAKTDPVLLRQTLFSVAHQIGSKFVYSQVEGEYTTAQVKNALEMLRDAGVIIPVWHTAANGIPLGAEINPKFVKYNLIDHGFLLNLLGIGDTTNALVKELLVANAADLVDKGSLTEMVAGLELLKYMSSNERHDLYYWQNLSRGTVSEVDYVLSRGIDIVPLEVKSGLRGSMASLYVFMEKEHIKYAIRCSLENFGEFISPKGKEIIVNPLYALSNLFRG